MRHLNRRHFLGAGLLLGASTLLGKETPAKPIAIPQTYTPPVIAFPDHLRSPPFAQICKRA